ncbi:hypothetical protein GP2143_09280 [marine gamma proteobacterium HTCC2143]|uniref:DUF3604 domain-containing protein n=1 Tax=marine gamma proteobacterium HTCC2143 TaxID=247633 RepID=A0YFH2_9GAMM|nr:hypothetical protein GP2143_09280 [marine gamma proteobacterium HTCC2143]
MIDRQNEKKATPVTFAQRGLAMLTIFYCVSFSPALAAAEPQQPLWGDTHLHTALSGDAVAYGLLRSPADAYNIATGKRVTTPEGQIIQLTRPLDFLVIADHAEGYGLVKAIIDGNQKLLKDPVIRRWAGMLEAGKNALVGQEMIQAQSTGNLPDVIKDGQDITRGLWLDMLKTADAYNQPGEFTAMIGFEWSAAPQGNNLHRVVVYRDGGDLAATRLPLDTAVSGMNPEKLWAWMADYEKETGGKILAIPHNANLSNGQMFQMVDGDGSPLSASYASLRARWEPLVEVTQIKGDGEAHPLLSRNDEFADFETWDIGNLIGSREKSSDMLPGEYAREALKNGLIVQQQSGSNPFKFGMIGSTDSHTSVTASEENNFWGKFATTEPHPGRWVKHRKPLQKDGWQYSASGLAAVWARDNNRASIFDAMQRREVYATTGPRITLRLFAGWSFDSSDLTDPDIASLGYSKGIPMGGDLTAAPAGQSLSLMMTASKDPQSGNLDRLQVVKGWVDTDNQTFEKIYNVAWSGLRELTAEGTLPPVGNTVDVADASWTNSIGEPQLSVVWTDPDFDSNQHAFYYVRALEIPTPRWTAYDAKRFGESMNNEVPMTIQERAYSSPIWYTP